MAEASARKWLVGKPRDLPYPAKLALDNRGLEGAILEQLEISEGTSQEMTRTGKAGIDEIIRHHGCARIEADLEALGGGAVEMLSLLLDRNELVLAPRPRSWAVEDFWQPGNTLARPISDYVSEDGTFVLGRFTGGPSGEKSRL